MEFVKLDKLQQEAIISKMASLYLFNMLEYLEQTDEGYVTHKVGKPSFVKMLDLEGKERTLPRFPRPMSVQHITDHLLGYRTYGVKAGAAYARFITFDIDCEASRESSLEAARALLYTLETHFKVAHDALHVVFSGKKGYHVTIYFEKPVARKLLKQFHSTVIRYVDYPSEVNIEHRPTGQGVKMPLGIHRTADGKPRSWFVDKTTFEPIQDFRYLLSIEPVKDTSFLNIQPEELKQLEPARKAPIQSREYFALSDEEKADLKGFASALLQNMKLTQAHTRHTATFALAIHCYTLGYSKDYATKLVLRILDNTEPHYIALDRSKWQEETERVIGICYKAGYKFKAPAKESIRFTKPELDKIMELQGFKLKYFAFVMLSYGKLYGPSFFFPFSVAEKVTGLNSRYTIALYRDTLIEAGLIDWGNRGSIDIEASNVKGYRMFERAIFELKPVPYSEHDSYMDVTLNPTRKAFISMMKRFYSLEEIRKQVSKHEYYGYWRAG